MKFKVYTHNASYYMAEMGDDIVSITPTSTYTVLQYNRSTYILAYGLSDYQMLVKQSGVHPNEFSTLIKQATATVGNSSHKKLVSLNKMHLYRNKARGLSGSLDDVYQLLMEYKPKTPKDKDNYLTISEFKSVLDDVTDPMQIQLDPAQVKQFAKLGIIDNPEIDYLISALIELMHQLDDAGILDTMEDPSAMVKAYDERGESRG